MKDFLKFIDKAVTQYHAVAEMEKKLVEANFIRLYEEEPFTVECGKSYYVVRNTSSILAFKVPQNLRGASINVVASHTDSPTFKLKPNNKLVIQNTYTSLNTEVYGGPIYSSFFDRPLSLAGRVFVKKDNKIEERLINFDRDLLVIPNECIHFNREVNSGKKYNEQIDLLPLLGGEDADLDKMIRHELKLEKNEEVLSYDIQIYNRYRGSVIGANKEFFMAPQIDNLESAYATLLGFITAQNDESLNVWVSFDNEEVGSRTKQGAASGFLSSTLKRVYNALGLTDEDLSCGILNGLFVSCDNAHAMHPNNPCHTDSLNKVLMNKGIVIKSNANQAYTTDGLSQSLLKSIFDNAKVPYQFFTNRSDVRGGSTLGAISLGQVSMPSVDIGLAQLAMHSACEVAGSKDFDILVEGMKAFYSTIIKKDKGIYILR